MRFVGYAFILVLSVLLVIWGSVISQDHVAMFIGVGILIVGALLVFLGGEEKKKKGGFVLTYQILLDGRIMDVIDSGIITEDIYIPSSVIETLEKKMEDEEELVREKSKLTLEGIKELMDKYPQRVDVFKCEKTPAAIVRFADKNGFTILGFFDEEVLEYANMKGVPYIPFEKVVLQLRRRVFVGEELNVFLVKPGKDPGQAVGFLEDNSMVVVDNASKYISKKVRVKIKNILKVNGKKQLVFADIISVVDQGQK